MRDRRRWTLVLVGGLATALIVAFGSTACGFGRTPRFSPSTPPPPSSAEPDPRDCARAPSACGYPDETNTGVPAGTKLTVHDGDLEVDRPGTVVENLDIRGCVRVLADDVTIRRTKITCTGYWGIEALTDEAGVEGLLIEDVEVDCQGAQGTAIGYSQIVVRRVNLHHCENGVDINDHTTVEDSYIHDMTEDSDGHADGIQFGGGGPDVVIRHNTIRVPGGTSEIITGKGGQFNHITIEDNLLGGGAFTLYCPEEPGSVGFRVLDNRFVRDAAYGPWTDCGPVEKRGNIWDDTLTAVDDE
jgi:hypothetical protein